MTASVSPPGCEMQKRAAAAGLPCATPLTAATERAGRTVHAEEWRPGGSMRHDDGPEHAVETAQVFAAVMHVTLAADFAARLVMPNPVWVRWEHSGSVFWPRFDLVDTQQQRTDTPTLAPLASSGTFLAAYEDAAGRRSTSEEVEVAWAASMYPAAHNARAEVLFGNPLVAGDALRTQAAERLRRGGA